VDLLCSLYNKGDKKLQYYLILSKEAVSDMDPDYSQANTKIGLKFYKEDPPAFYSPIISFLYFNNTIGRRQIVLLFALFLRKQPIIELLVYFRPDVYVDPSAHRIDVETLSFRAPPLAQARMPPVRSGRLAAPGLHPRL
jgi:hypothetical protein